MTTYLVKNNDDGKATVTATKASGPQLHLLDEGPTIGKKWAYSGEVVAGVNYYVDNGPTLGIGESHT